MQLPSGKFVVRLKPKLHEQLRNLSRQRNISLNELCSEKLQELSKPIDINFVDSVVPKQILVRIQSEFSSLLGLILFGSAARNEATVSSDIDLLLVLPSSYAISRELYREWDKMTLVLQKDYPMIKKISPHFVALPTDVYQSGSLWFEVALDGKLLFQVGNTLSNFLYLTRTHMASGKIQRQTSHGHPYWIRKVEDEK